MPKRRTLKEKLEAQESRQRAALRIPAAPVSATYTLNQDTTIKRYGAAEHFLSNVNQKHIAKDLFKTLLISAILFTLLIGIYFYLGYN